MFCNELAGHICDIISQLLQHLKSNVSIAFIIPEFVCLLDSSLTPNSQTFVTISSQTTLRRIGPLRGEPRLEGWKNQFFCRKSQSIIGISKNVFLNFQFEIRNNSLDTASVALNVHEAEKARSRSKMALDCTMYAHVWSNGIILQSTL